MVVEVIVESLVKNNFLDAVEVHETLCTELASVQLCLVQNQLEAVWQLEHTGQKLVLIVVFAWNQIRLVQVFN